MPQAFKELGNQFEEALKEEDETEFIKKCADFYFDFMKVHPYTDVNGRTIRILLPMMLASRNIILPSLYETGHEHLVFNRRSNAALKGDYSVIEQMIMEKIEEGQKYIEQLLLKKKQEVNRTDMENNHTNVSSNERINGMTSLRQKINGIDEEKGKKNEGDGILQ